MGLVHVPLLTSVVPRCSVQVAVAPLSPAQVTVQVSAFEGPAAAVTAGATGGALSST